MRLCPSSLVAAVLAALPVALAAPAAADTLRVALAVDASTLDPHYHAAQHNAQVAKYLFEPLVALDDRQRLIPGLAVAWTMETPTRWVFRLREGVRFHDGAPFAAEDAVASIRRAPAVEGSPGGFGTYLRQVVRVAARDPLTVVMETAAPHPALPWDLTAINMISARAATATTQDFNSGAAALGTGPFRLVSWARGDRLELARNDAWWGPRPAWARVTLSPMVNDAARLAALLSGQVDLIEAVPTTALADLRGRDDIRLHRSVTSRLIFLAMDSARETTPFATVPPGAPANPFRDARVRRAVSLAVDRESLTRRIMDGAAIPAAQLMPTGVPGTSQHLVPDPHDPAGARRLLAEAGYPDGFDVVLHGPVGRYVNDEKVVVAIAGMLRRVGIRARVEALPGPIFKSRGSRREFTLFLDGWGTETGDVGLALRALLGSPDPVRGRGGFNRGGFSSAAFDRALDEAQKALDPAERTRLLGVANEVAMAEAGLVPLYFQEAVWASRRGIAFTPRADEYTLAVGARPDR